MLLGCPGTLDDPTSFEEREPGLGAGSPVDAGTRPRPDDAGSVAPAADAGSSAGGIDGGKASAGGSAASCDFRALIETKCGSSGCHGAPALSTGLDLTSDGLAGRLKNKQASGACSDYLLIDPVAPERSALYLMVTDDSCGIRMPLGGTLSAAEQTCVLSWIENL